ncbi:sulfite exporter TauE/SafE family protein [Leptolyngbya sp. 7M]|uniref:sulfite exporter TauE/SafE family protein n=1 Tax=Leptolyngbya sp. 7M TaxID=2812896 RepID=UPI001B8BAB1F|nr:sulfite exporter TauE/SafE family protein [Leptolyngbya sp. 7M]QYO65759.1 sulfite exporter TauE/SafE family protein [Leptolyngbya sp. 7M]QYU67590.1 sulfite exporter TauE/SafE family protein [Leptolyngbya sp. 15MV]
MSAVALLGLLLLFFITSAVGVITGSNSLITVPVMFQFGIDEKVAVATNMFGLTFMAAGATIPFFRSRKLEINRLVPLIAVTLIGSALGAMLVGAIPNSGIRLIVSIAMLAIVAFTLFQNNGDGKGDELWRITTLGLAVTFFLAIYGGLYSGGYVTLLTAAFVAFMGMTYSGAIAATKLINVFSSLIATIVFMWQGLVDYRLGVLLAATMFVGAYAGAHFVTKMSETWLRRVFVATVILLAVKTLYDLV